MFLISSYHLGVVDDKDREDNDNCHADEYQNETGGKEDEHNYHEDECH